MLLRVTHPVALPVSLLLRLLLISLLVVNTTASAWAAAGMATTMLPAPASTHAGMATAAAKAIGSDCHATVVQAEEPAMPCGNDGQHCDCLHACSVLPCPVHALQTDMPAGAPPHAQLRQGTSPQLAEPVRPPIPSHS